MINPTSSYHKILVQDLEEKMHRVDFCLFRGSRLIQEIDTLTANMEVDEDDGIELDNRISETKAFIYTGHDNIEELREIYQELKDKKYQAQGQDKILWLFADYASSTSNSEHSYFAPVPMSPLPDLKDLVHEFEEKMLQAKVCLFHSKERVQQLCDLVQEEAKQDLVEKMIEIRSFICAGYKEMQQMGELYRSLKEEKYPPYRQAPSTDSSFLESLKGILHA